MCAACEFLMSGTLLPFVWLFVVRALGSIEKGGALKDLIIIIIIIIIIVIIIYQKWNAWGRTQWRL